MAAPEPANIRLGRYSSRYNIGEPRPSISWSFADCDVQRDFIQTSYEITIQRSGSKNVYTASSDRCIGLDWPTDEADLRSREAFSVSIRVKGSGDWSAGCSADFETSLIQPSDWTSRFITLSETQDPTLAKRPYYIASTFELSEAQSQSGAVRVYATALGVYELEINGVRVGDEILAPGWQSYKHRLHFQTYRIPPASLRPGRNTIGAVIGEGWYAGHLTWDKGRRNLWGAEIGISAQVEADGKVLAATGEGDWKWDYGAIESSELYNGEVFDFSHAQTDWAARIAESGKPARVLDPPEKIRPRLISPEAPPIRAIETVKVQEIITTPSGKRVLDFGQNLVGWVRVKTVPARSESCDSITLRFAEVMEHGELGVRPLRDAKCTDVIKLDSNSHTNWEPKFTTHGFRYVEVSGGIDVREQDYLAVVVHSDMERLGDFSCSHAMLNQLHSNVTWGLRGNFVGLPTDCPQRDERLGWTGDIQVFTPTASFLYDTSALLANWLHDLHAEQLKDYDGVPGVVVPDVLQMWGPPHPEAVWSDVTSLTPEAMHQAYGNTRILSESWESMSAWLDKGVKRGTSGLWDQPPGEVQLGDWLDPNAPPNNPGDARTDPFLVADAYLVHCTLVVGKIAKVLGRNDESARYTEQHGRLRTAFRHRYITPEGLLTSDSQTAYCLALHFGFLEGDQIHHATDRLVHLVVKNEFKIGTGFAGTPLILMVLAAHGKLSVAYRMLQEKKCPSWLYPISLGATTIWERWDSMLPDGSINPGDMTSFNHYALGSVAHFLHSVIGGISPIEPGWKRFRIAPRPGGTVTSAKVSHRSPYGLIRCEWTLESGAITVRATVPPNTTAEVQIGDEQQFIAGSGQHEWHFDFQQDPSWPPKLYKHPFMPPKEDSFAE